MARTAFISYACYFSTREAADLAISLLNGETSVEMNPFDASELFGFPWPPPTGPVPENGLHGPLFPYILGSNIPNPGPSGVLVDGTLDSMTVPGQVIGNGFPPSDVLILRWSMSVIIRANETVEILTTAAMPPRRWAMGWEAAFNSEFHPQSGTGSRARDSSRVVDGTGMKYRGETSSGSPECNLSNSEGTGLPTRSSWERFYIRIRNVGAINGSLWYCTGSLATLSGAKLNINTDRTLTGVNVNNVGVNDNTFGTTQALELDTWYKIDILVEFANGILNGAMGVYINGVLQFLGQQGTGSTGLGQIQNHRATSLFVFASNNAWEIDIDDWHNAEFPSILGVLALNSSDWLYGTHVKSSYVAAGVATNWTGIIAAMDGWRNPSGSALQLASTTAGAVIDIETNLKDFSILEEQESTGIVTGPITVSASVSGSSAGALSGQVGYRLAGGAVVSSVLPLSGAGFFSVKTYLPPATLTPYITPIAPFHVTYQKGADAVNVTVNGMVACCQYIGMWGLEDVPAEWMEWYPSLIPDFGVPIIHNCRYPESSWAVVTAKPDGPVCVTCNRYTGNGTFQTIGVFLPFQILVIRNTSTGTPVMVFSTSLAPQVTSIGAAVAADVPLITIDPITGLATFEVVGNGARVNQSAVVYEFFLFSDPALRYSIAGVFNHGAQTIQYNNPLIDGSFTPEYGIFMATFATPGGLWFKGPSHTALEVSTVAGTLLTDGVQFTLGSIITGADLSETFNETSYDLFRTDDGSGLVMVQILTYVGNGLASRVIPLTPASGRFPLAAFVTRRGGAVSTVYRDAFHAGVNSIFLGGGGNTTTGIIGGGIDSITVGIGLNANLAQYDVLVFPGTSSGWLEGTYCGPGGIPPGDFWDDDPEPLPPGIINVGEGGLILGGGGTSISLFKNLSGIYTLVPGKHSDTLYDRQTAQPSVELPIPDPRFKTGYIGG